MNKANMLHRDRNIGMLLALLLAITVSSGAATDAVNAAATTVTLKMGALETYGSYSTYTRWITHIDGEPVDLDDEPGVTRSYAYCVQPAADPLESGEYSVTVIDDDNTGRTEKMRKMIYYLPGAYGYKKVTKARWFDTIPSGTSAYTLGHIALSYLYDNCNADTDAFKGTNAAIKDKVKSIVKDLDKLDDPPEDFEVFWIKVSGKQDVFGAFYKTEYGKLSVTKTSTWPEISDGNRCYSLAGAKYTLFEDKDCTKPVKLDNGSDAVITTKEDGTADSLIVETGEYFLRETTAPPGYALNLDVIPIEISKDKTTRYEDEDAPKSNPVGVLIQKVDAETGRNRPQGAASLKDAEFTVKYYDQDGSGGEPLRTWVFVTDEEGKVDVRDEKCFVADKSSPLYRNSDGQIVIPIGTITVTENAAPEGYSLNEEVFARSIRDEGTIEELENLETLTDDNAVKERVHRGDLALVKSVDGGRRLANVVFRLTSLTTGETHYLMTDANGYIDTRSGWNPHDTMDDEHITSHNGVWFDGYADSSEGAPVNNAVGALPYDSYSLEELRGESNKNYDLISDVVTITRDNTLVRLGTYDDMLITATEPATDDPGKPHIPKTGDNNVSLILLVTMMVLAITEAVLLTAKKKNDRLCAERDKE